MNCTHILVLEMDGADNISVVAEDWHYPGLHHSF